MNDTKRIEEIKALFDSHDTILAYTFGKPKEDVDITGEVEWLISELEMAQSQLALAEKVIKVAKRFAPLTHDDLRDLNKALDNLRESTND